MEIPFVVKVASAHRSPERLVAVLKEFEKSAQVVIAFAGHAAHLGGVIASKVICPVIAVPLPTSDLLGIDALLSSVQMPGGVPVAVMAIGESGSFNAACFATQILALKSPQLLARWKAFKDGLESKVTDSSTDVEQKWKL